MPSFDIICLANSRKHSGRCVAGLRTDGSGWVRPVGALPDGTLYPSDYHLNDLTEPGGLDVIRVGVHAPRPLDHQPENWQIDGSRWQLVARPVPPNLLPLLRGAVTSGPELLRGTSDRLAVADLQRQPIAASLALVAPESVDLYHQLSYRGRPQARGRFALGPAGAACLYDLSITDPIWESRIIHKGPQTLRQSEAEFFLTVSLGEPLGLNCYKLIAAIILL
jgi:hypothetical protein